MQWTEAQKQAIDARGDDLLVSAAAGSGKTAVMVERVLQLIKEGISIDDMLIVTFTRAAAGDMRRKFHEKLAAEAARGDIRMREQLSLLETAEICTLHSFCAALLRDHFEKADIAPDFHVVNGRDLRMMIDDEAANEVLEEEFSKNDPDVAELNYGRGPDAVKQLVLDMADGLMKRPDPEVWIERVLEYDPEDDFRRTMIDDANRQRRQALAFFKTALNECMLPDGPMAYSEALMSDIDQCSDDITELQPFEVSFARLKSLPKGFAGTESAERVKDLRTRGKKCIGKAAELMGADIELLKADTQSAKRVIRVLARMALKVNELRTAKKAEKHVLTFDDLEMQALKCLEDDDVCELVQQKYSCVFVDEYQDTSDIQNAILNRVARPGTLFMVGDVKQSIYRFRDAEPGLFLEKYGAFLNNDGGRMIALSTNFRSRPAILEFVNRVFEKLMIGGDSEIEYDDAARLNPGASYAGDDPEVCIRIIDRGADTAAPQPEADGETPPEEDAVEIMSAAAREGALVAREIRSLMEKDPTLHFSDIAVLSRKSVNVFGEIYAALDAAGIPAYIDSEGGYYDTYEVSLIMAVLTLIVNPANDPEWIMVMRSVLGGFTLDDLAEIRIAHRSGSFYEAATEMARGEGGLAEKTRGIIGLIDGFAALRPALSVSNLIDRILTDTGLTVYFANLPGSGTRMKNLTILMEKADRFESVYADGLTGFIQLADRERRDNDAGSAHELNEGDDVVRLMTVHKSKGLEFRAVFGVQLGASIDKKPVGASSENKLLMDRSLGIGMNYIDTEMGSIRRTMPVILMEKAESTMARAEELRILYVMLTRPKEYLYLIGTVKKLSKSAAIWEVSKSGEPVYSSYLDMIMDTVGEEDADIAVIPENEIRSAAARSGGDTIPETLRMISEALADPITSGEMYDAVFMKYKHADAAYLPTKLTASGLKRILEGPVERLPESTEPNFISGKKTGGAMRGTAYHRALYAMRLEGVKGLSGKELHDEVRAQLSGMIGMKRLRADEAELIRPEYIERLYLSDFGRRMLASDTVKREWRFNVIMPVNDAFETDTYPEDEDIVVQGSIDLAFREDGGWVLADYKTDSEADTDAILDKHRQQLRLYAAAIERITGEPVKERVIWLISRAEALCERRGDNMCLR